MITVKDLIKRLNLLPTDAEVLSVKINEDKIEEIIFTVKEKKIYTEQDDTFQIENYAEYKN